MGGRETVADAFGLILIGTAAILALWEFFQQRSRERDVWFVTRRRYRRRLTVSVLMALIGALMSAEAHRILPFDGISGVLIYAVTLCTAAVLLLVLAFADVADTINSAARKSLAELDAVMRAAEGDAARSDPDEPSST